MFAWTEKSIRWYADAVAFTGFGLALTERLLPFLPRGETVCDLGCGIGYLALELARRGYAVTAVDLNGTALAALREERERLGLENLSIQRQDWASLGESPLWDNVVMVCAGGEGRGTGLYRRLCRKRLLVVDRTTLTSHVRGEGQPSAYRAALGDWERDPVFRGRFDLEFGQPFRSVADAEEYIGFMGGHESAEQVLARLEKTGDPEFPLYLPHRKELELRVFESGLPKAGAEKDI